MTDYDLCTLNLNIYTEQDMKQAFGFLQLSHVILHLHLQNVLDFYIFLSVLTTFLLDNMFIYKHYKNIHLIYTAVLKGSIVSTYKIQSSK